MRFPSSRRVRLGLVAAAVVLLVIGGAAVFLILRTPGNVSHPNVEFTTTTTTGQTTSTRRVVVNTFEWPRYGFDAARTRYFPAGHRLDPPLRVGWTYEDHALLEFPPDIYQNALYGMDDDASVKSIDKLNGHLFWQRKLGTLAAASPGLDILDKLVLVPILSDHGKGPGGGSFEALSMRNGHVVWSKPLRAGSESSPLVYGKSVYFGDQSGTVYSLDARTGHVNWTYHAQGAVKSGPAYANGAIYFGDYAGRAYALNARTGHQMWAVGTNGSAFGFGSGNFYATPAVAFGRVYMGNTDGRVYSFAARTGQLAWATTTGAYVYASAAVTDVSGIGPTVYIGSYDGTFYAFNARSGAVRWTHRAGGRISGSATVVGNVVYFSDLGSRTTTGLNAQTGKSVFHFPDGAFNPVICDYGAIYLSGYSKLYQLLPKRAPHIPARPAASSSASSSTRGSTHQPAKSTPKKRKS